jgi:hypothetical protein
MALPTGELERILNRVHEWTRTADVKTDILTAVQAGVLGFLLPGINAVMADSATTFWYEAGFVAGVVLLVLALAHSVMALFPRLSRHSLWGLLSGERAIAAQPSVTFFGHIALWKLSEYRERVNSISDEELREDYIRQIHTSAIIASRKHRDVKRAIQLFCAGLFVVAVTYLRLRRWF